MLRKMFNMNFKLMLNQRDFLLAFFSSLLLFLIPAIIDIATLYGQDIAALAPAWCYFGVVNGIAGSILSDFVQMYNLFFFPFTVSMAFSACEFDEKNLNVDKFIITRSGRAAHYLSQALVTFTGGFLMVFLPSVLSELTLMAAIPLQSNKLCPYYPLDPALLLQNVNFFQYFCCHYPYLYYFVYDIIGSVIGGLIGLLSYSISLYFKVNRFLVITIPGIIYLAAGLILDIFGLHAMTPENLIVPPIETEGIKPIYSVILIGGLLAIDFISVLGKIYIKKDEV